MKTNQKKEMGLILSGGGALGVAHLGVYRAIHDFIKPTYIIGTSAGAIIGAAIAVGLSPKEISEQLYQKSLFKLAFDFSFKKGGIISGDKILELLKNIFEDRNFSDLPKNITLKVCATNFNTGDLVVISNGNIAEAVRASISVPGLFAPFWINNVPLVDGGLVANLPLKYALNDFNEHEILAVDILSCIPENEQLKLGQALSVRKAIERSLRLIFYNQVKNITPDDRLHLLKIPLENFHSADLLKLPQIETVGYETTVNYLKKIGLHA